MEAVEGEPLADAVRGHVQRCWPGAKVDVLRWTEGGLVENLPDLRVVRIAPSAPDAPWIYVSAGVSAEPMEDGYGIEVLVVTREEAPLAVKLVAMVANLHADPRYPLSMGQVLEIGQPWLPGASSSQVPIWSGFPQPTVAAESSTAARVRAERVGRRMGRAPGGRGELVPPFTRS